jgi:lipopolysaccharide/colanic/teichoic acid biosynthesis glycosyltransferase
MAWAGAGLGVVGAGLGWLAGPWVVELAYGSGFEIQRIDAAVISLGVVFAGSGLFVGQILVARGQALRLGVAWLGGLLAAASAVLVSAGAASLTRVSIAFAAGAGVALIALVYGALAGMESEQPSASAAYLASKRTIDIAISLFVLVLASPVLALAGLAVRLDSPGPIFFKQWRVGRGGRRFGLLKIRTMEADADEAVFAEHLARLEASRFSDDGTPIRIADDHRITRVGRTLRRWSIDELPNWNVLLGSMSLVGPRPLVPAEAELVGLDSPRFQVKPGITGLAQVEGRDTITIVERTRLDEEYVSRRSPSLDTRIMLKTIRTVFVERGD